MVTMEDVRQAAMLSHAHEFIMSLPQVGRKPETHHYRDDHSG